MESRFTNRELVREPKCPFCGNPLERPCEVEGISSRGMELGTCRCGATYAHDATGHNLGSAMSEALVYGCGGDWDRAWNLMPDEDYLQDRVENYDIESHLIVPGGTYDGRRIAGVLYFILMKSRSCEVEPLPSSKLEVPGTSSTYSAGKSRLRRSYSKGEIEGYIRDYNMAALLEIAASDSRVIRSLQRMLYSVDPIMRSKASEAMGRTAAVIAEREPAVVINLLQGLITSVTDTAASSWGSVAAIGEIIGANPKRFGGYLPHLLRLSGDRILLRDVLAALGTISVSSPGLLRKYTYHFIPLLRDPSSEIRGLAAILLANLGAVEAGEDLESLLEDDSELEVYKKGSMETVTVRALAKEALERL